MNAKTLISVGLLVMTWSAPGTAGQTSNAAAGSERFEVTSIKAVRPTLVDTIAALQRGDPKGAKTTFDAFDSAWNGIEVYINTRSPELYGAIETNYEAKIMKALDAPPSDLASVVADARAMLGKFDEALTLVQREAPLNPLYDDIARLRIVRAHLREVNPALKNSDLAKARTSFGAFNEKWDSIEDLVKARSREAYDGIEKGMIDIERALMENTPDGQRVTALVASVMDKYNGVVAQITREARNAK
jgi:hypothetical protein